MEETPQSASSPVGVPKDHRLWGMLCHLSAFGGFVVPFGNIIVPLIIWMIKKDEMAFVNDQGKESLNFQITMTLALLVSFLLIAVAIGIILVIIVPIVALIFMIIAAIKANDGIAYRYPMSIRFIR